MKCKNCGEQNAEGAKFCSNCGLGLEPAENEPLNQENYKPVSKPPITNKNKAVAIALGIAGVLSVILFVIILTMLGTKNIDGKWYSPSLGQAMEFRENDEVIVYTPMGAYLGAYTYDKKSGSGVIAFPGVAYNFVADGENITVYDQNGVPAVYLKMDNSMDLESIISMQNITAEPAGSQNDITEQPQVTEAGVTDSPTPTAQPATTPPIATVGPTATPTNTPVPTPTPTPTLIPIITPTPIPTLHFSFLPIPVYTIAPYHEIAGKFYSVSGEDGIFEFAGDYRYSYDSSGGGILFTTGDFTYNSLTNQGTMHPDFTLMSIPFSYNDTTEILTVQGREYTRTYVPQS